jgi:hypothetical protein
MPRIDRNAQVNNRTRRNWQRLEFGSATTNIALNPGANNALISTTTGYGVFVDGSTITIIGSTIGAFAFMSTEGDLLTVNSTGAKTRLPRGSPSYILTTTINGATSTDLQWQSTLQYAGSAQVAVAWMQARLVDTSNIIALDWSPLQRRLNDITGTASIFWDARLLKDSVSVTSVDWDLARSLYDGAGHQSLDWDNWLLVDYNGVTSLGWSTRVLNNSSGSTVLNWQSTTLFSSSGSTIWNWSSTYPSTYVLAAPATTIGLMQPRGLSTGDIANLSTAVFPVTSADPASPAAGQAWYNSTLFRPKTNYGGGSTGTIPVCVFASSVTASVQASTSALTITPYSYTFPASTLNHLGSMIKIRADMSFTTTLTNTYTVILYINNAPFEAIFINTITTGQSAVIEIDIAIGTSTTGTTGHLIGVGKYVGTVAGAGAQGSLGVNNAAYDLTSTITLAWTVSAASNNANDTANMISADYLLM